jgi:threonine/homoserine/homoserine lactone efflux protein
VAVQIMLLATVLNLIGIAVNGAVILMVSRLGRSFVGRNRPHRWPQFLLGTVFAGLALRLAFDGKR